MFFLLSPVGPRQNSKSSILSPRWEVHATKRFNWEYEFDPSFPIHLFPYQVMGNKDVVARNAGVVERSASNEIIIKRDKDGNRDVLPVYQ